MLSRRCFVFLRQQLCYAILLAGIVVLFSRDVLADPLEDWKRADEVKGCAGIPYMELARKCMDTMVEVGEICKEVKWSCAGGDIPSLKGNEDEAANRKKLQIL